MLRWLQGAGLIGPRRRGRTIASVVDRRGTVVVELRTNPSMTLKQFLDRCARRVT